MRNLFPFCGGFKKFNSVVKSSMKCHLSCGMSTFRPKTNHVWISLSTNIYRNLALEDWLYQNTDFQDQNLLLLWRNSSCVVVGRHQNPWVECDVPTAVQQGVNIARRNSGGGTVYHDLGNMCLTFFSSRDRYNRVENLNFMSSVLRKYFEIDVGLNDRDDIILEGKYKISGTAAKLSGKKSYHHCTLMLDVDCNLLNQVLKSRFIDIESRATESVRSKVKNLKAVKPSLTYQDLVLAFTREFVQEKSGNQGEVRYVMEPISDAKFSGISQITANLKDWTWVFAKTPKFTIDRTFNVYNQESGWGSINIKLSIEKGTIITCELNQENYKLSNEFISLLNERLTGTTLRYEEIIEAIDSIYEENMSVLDQGALQVIEEYLNNLLR